MDRGINEKIFAYFQNICELSLIIFEVYISDLNFNTCLIYFIKIWNGDDMINAIKFTDELEKAGFTPEQAKKSVDTWMSLINDNFATKSDFREFQLINKADLKDLQIHLQEQSRDMRSDLEGQIKDLRSDLRQVHSTLLIRLSGVVVATGTIMISIMALLLKH